LVTAGKGSPASFDGSHSASSNASYRVASCRHGRSKAGLRTRNAVHGGLVEMVVWNVPEPVPLSSHHDNERGKGDHKHLQGRQAIEHQIR